MKTTPLLLLLLTLVPHPSGARDRDMPPAAAEALKSGTKFTLFSLYPPSLYGLDPQPMLRPEESLHDYKILGSTDLTDPKQRESAITIVNEAIRAFKGTVAGCFEPRHALRVHTPKAVFDFVICFACHYIKVFRGDEYLSTIPIAGSADSMDAILRAANVPLARRLDFK